VESPHLLRNERGQAIAEFALILWILVVMLFSIIEMGLMLNSKLVLVSCAREAARMCAVEGGNTASVRQVLYDNLSSAGIGEDEVSVTIAPNQAIYGTMIRVNLEYRYRVKSPVVAALVGPTISLTARAVTRSEFVPR